MIRKLPRWVLVGGTVLAFSAGAVNTIVLLGFTHLSVSHVTGNVSLLSGAIASLDWQQIAYIGASLLAFFAGAMLSGIVIGQSSLKLGRRYGMALFFEAVLLIASYLLFRQHAFFGQLTSAMACGLQNAMVATYSGAVIRTTHLTGITSDMGASIGNWLAGRPVNLPMLRLQASIWLYFCAGGVVGAFLFYHVYYQALLLPIAVVSVAGMLYHRLSHQLPERRSLG